MSTIQHASIGSRRLPYRSRQRTIIATYHVGSQLKGKRLRNCGLQNTIYVAVECTEKEIAGSAAIGEGMGEFGSVGRA